MRIIAGQWRGRPLMAPKGDATRPTADRTREALFSMLEAAEADFDRVLDLYAGSGALGIEALSRGEGEARFGLAWVDISSGSFRVASCEAGRLAAEIARIEPREIVPRIVREDKYGDFGSGYLTDSKTTNFLNQWLKAHDEYPDCVRKSWKPAKQAKNEKGTVQKKLA